MKNLEESCKSHRSVTNSCPCNSTSPREDGSHQTVCAAHSHGGTSQDVPEPAQELGLQSDGSQTSPLSFQRSHWMRRARMPPSLRAGGHLIAEHAKLSLSTRMGTTAFSSIATAGNPQQLQSTWLEGAKLVRKRNQPPQRRTEKWGSTRRS